MSSPLLPSVKNALESEFAKMGLKNAQYHVFLCGGPDCCNPAEGEKTWECLKKRLKELQLPVLRSKVNCFRICIRGPWLVVYPDGIWYEEVTPQRCEKIITQHLMQGEPVKEWIITTHPLERPLIRDSPSSPSL